MINVEAHAAAHLSDGKHNDDVHGYQDQALLASAPTEWHVIEPMSSSLPKKGVVKVSRLDKK